MAFLCGLVGRYNDPRAPCMLSDGGGLPPNPLHPVPNKSKLVKLLSPSLRQSFLVFALALPTHPKTEAKTIFHMVQGNATVTFALLVDRQIAEAFRPARFKWVPNKSKLV